MDIKILGTGCMKCQQLETLTRTPVPELRLDATIDKVTGPGEIAAWGVRATPAVVVVDAVVTAGRVSTRQAVTALLSST